MTTDVAVRPTSLAQTEDTTYTCNQIRVTTSKFSVIYPNTWAGKSILEPILLGMCLFGFIANLAMLISLLMYRQATKKTTNIFIFNQTVLDLVASFVQAAKRILMMSGYLNVKTGVLRMLTCLLIESDAITSSIIYGAVYGLVVITVERYVKIVHSVAHRNHYRRWMTYVGVATPWLIGLFTSALPSLTTAHFIDGVCTMQVRSAVS